MRDRGSMKKLFTATALLCLTFTACAPAQSVETVENSAAAVTHVAKSTTGPRAPFKSIRSDGLEELIIAGGCFWCVEADFEKVKGVQAAISGYTGGGLDSPSYKKVVTWWIIFGKPSTQQMRADSFAIKAKAIGQQYLLRLNSAAMQKTH